MKTIALEEHYRHPGIKEAVERRNPALLKEFAGSGVLAERFRKLEDLGETRLQDMDEASIDVQVLSHTYPATEGLPFRETNHKTVMDESMLRHSSVRKLPGDFSLYPTWEQHIKALTYSFQVLICCSLPHDSDIA